MNELDIKINFISLKNNLATDFTIKKFTILI